MFQSEILKQSYELMKEAETIRELKGKDKLKFVQEKLKEYVKAKEWNSITKEEAFFFIDTVLPHVIELTISYSKVEFVKEVTTICCGWKFK